MTTLLQYGLRMAARVIPVAAGGAWSFSRGSDCVIVNAACVDSEYEIDSDNVVRLSQTNRDFIFRSAELILSGSATVPQAGDRLTAGAEIFEVMAPPGLKVFRYCDTEKNLMRAHANKIQ